MDFSDVSQEVLDKIMTKLPQLLEGVNDQELDKAIDHRDIEAIARRLSDMKSRGGGDLLAQRVAVALHYVVMNI